MKYWSGKFIDSLAENEVFVFGSNPEGRHGAGAAAAAVKMGARFGESTGFSPNKKTYAIITKNLKPNYTDKYGVTYPIAGERSISTEVIKDKINMLYQSAMENPEKDFLISYQYETYHNGTPKKSLNGYTSKEMLEMFVKDQDIPDNIVFHDSYKPHVEKVLLAHSQVEQSSNKSVSTLKLETPKEIAFTKVSLPFGWMGNMAPYPIEYLGKQYKNTEALFQALRFEGFPEIQQKIMDEKSPMSAKMVAKEHKHLLEQSGYVVMGQKDVENMRLCVKLKLEQHPELAKQLIDTGNTVIIEDCTNRPQGSGVFWGACYENDTWIGKNVLGRVLMDFRDKLQNNKELVVNVYNQPEEKTVIQNETKSKNILSNLIVISPHDSVPEGFTVINTTSKDKNIGVQFSPFYLKDINLYEGKVAKNMENAWQFSKVYKDFADESGNPSDKYFAWANKGWNDSFAHRYANGKGNIPLYSYWKTYENGQWKEHQYDYVTARKNIYFPLYAKAIINSQAFKDLEQLVNKGEKIALWDFDGYNHEKRNMTYEDVVNSDKYKCGHAFVLYGLLTKQLKIINDELVYDFNLKIEEKQIMQNEIENKPKEYTFFFHLTSPFSNFHPSKFEYKELTFISNEQFMMYSKAKTFKDEATAKKIIEMNNTPLIKDFIEGKISREEIINDKVKADQWNKLMMKIKGFGKDVLPYNDEIWSNRRAKVVLFGAREKFSQNEDLKQILMNTGDTYMVEASPYDKIWGIGLSAGDAKRIPENKWPGLNLLGQVLDVLKTEYKAQLVNKGDSLPRKKF